ncbi:DUF3631 domain-containing protein [Leucobacter sp. gxy201]|uniref:DUF3631 domain-containing protein n=1 Tax=Leucobacter sp. gxy201 TaxID=2957200 RepID=UPI003DA004A0
MTGVPSALPPAADAAAAGAVLLDEMRAEFKRYTVQQTEHHYVALALYALYTHLSGAFRYAPRLVVTSAEKQSGKTRTLDILRELVSTPEVAANTTVASLFLAVMEDEEHPPTIILDEADTVFGTKVKAEQNEELRGFLNCGFQSGTPFTRANWVTKKRERYSTFAPAVLAAIGTLPETIVDRAVVIRLRRRRPGDSVERYRLRQAGALHALRERAGVWAEGVRARAHEYVPDTNLEDRPADVWEPLLTVADFAGGHWPQTARTAAAYLVAEGAGAAAEVTEGIELLTDLRGVLRMLRGERLSSSALLEYLRSIEASRWKDGDLTARRLSDLLKVYGIRPKRSNSQRYYLRAEIEAEIERYALPDAEADTGRDGAEV